MGRYDTPPSPSHRPRDGAPGPVPPPSSFDSRPDGGPPESVEPPGPWPDVPVEHDATVEAAPPPKAAGKAGRNLPVAIAVGLGLGAVVLASLLIYRQIFLFVVAAALAVAIWELSTAMRKADIRVPVWTLVGCGLGMLALTWFAGPPLLVVGLGVTVAVLVVWRLADGATGYHVDVPAATLVATYVPFLGAFAVLLVAPLDGHLRIIATLAVVVLSDTGGYVAGVLAGRHPMAPRISPKKSWEGLGGSLLACAIGGALLLYFMFDVTWWLGALFGITLAIAATLGDLTESMIKRDLGVKDMSNLIPGHGGLMDRLDSILFVLPVAYAWLVFLVPVTS